MRNDETYETLWLSSLSLDQSACLNPARDDARSVPGLEFLLKPAAEASSGIDVMYALLNLSRLFLTQRYTENSIRPMVSHRQYCGSRSVC